MNKSPESKVYIIGYLGTNVYDIRKQDSKGEWQDIDIRNLDKPKLLNKMFREIETVFIQSGMDASRIVKVNGGYKDETRSVEFWFVPKGSEIPKPKPDYFSKKKLRKKK